MPFLAEDEFVIGMDVTGYADGHFTDHDLDLLYQAGIRTLWSIDVDWNAIEPAKKQYNWSGLDSYMEKATRHGFKVILNCYRQPIQWASDHWYIWSMMGVHKDCISPWSREGVDYMLNFYRKMKERYTTPTSLVINSHLINGEWMLPDCQIYSGADQKRMRDQDIHDMFMWMMVEQTRILGDNPWKEAWVMLHPHLVPDEWVEEIVSRYTNLGFKVNHMYYTWAQWVEIWPWMDRLRQKYNENVFGGAEWASGILDTAPKAIGRGLRGLLCGPTHPFTYETEVKPWMVSNIQQAIERFKKR